jgi:hypothetical protein
MKGTCVICGRRVVVALDGCPYSHNKLDSTSHCYGSSYPAKEMKQFMKEQEIALREEVFKLRSK